LKGVTPECLNQVDLRAWLRNAPGMKPMYVDTEGSPGAGGKIRGMPNLNLSEDQIDQLITYLLERK
jgi:cytochrome c oxidase subunit 2